MSSIRTSRTRRVRRARLATAAAGVALAAFSLTACDDGSGVKDEGASAGNAGSASTVSDTKPAGTQPAPAGSQSATAAPKPTASAPAAPKPSASAPAANKPGAAEPAAPGKRVVCDASITRTTAAPVNRPVNHMLLTVTNTGSTACDLYYYPAVQFTGAQSVPPVIEESQPQAVVSLAPGQSGYAGVALASADGSGSHGYTAKSLTVHFAGPKGHSGYDGKAARPALPAGGVYLDDSVKVTYWQTSMDAALTW
ncbi:DUF4232 domain-containing protein [Streptomyces sp. NPDC102406]|uniref:DUF4232 domain-containing protein n=1 Tax=Streptomyces sp. NPDC102406 TaxID=3366171 RepID=UPI0037F23BCA